MKKIVIMLLFISVAFAGYSNSKYTIDDSKVETLIEQSTTMQFNFESENPLNVTSIQDEKDPLIAALLAFPYLVGGLGIHRVYLGTPPGIIAGYIFTCGGIFGVLPWIDFIVLLINSDDISPYIDKKGLIMFN